MNKVCSKCGQSKSLDKFYMHTGRLRPECKVCSNASDKRRNKHKPVVAPVVKTLTDDPKLQAWYDLGLEWRRPLYDPYQAANRYGGSRV